ncbi:hypothetical protein Tco_0494589 [Tanacetum coccineum]
MYTTIIIPSSIPYNDAHSFRHVAFLLALVCLFIHYESRYVASTIHPNREAIPRTYRDIILGAAHVQEELTALRFRADIAEAENASLRARIKTTEAIEKITCNRERQARVYD